MKTQNQHWSEWIREQHLSQFVTMATSLNTSNKARFFWLGYLIREKKGGKENKSSNLSGIRFWTFSNFLHIRLRIDIWGRSTITFSAFFGSAFSESTTPSTYSAAVREIVLWLSGRSPKNSSTRFFLSYDINSSTWTRSFPFSESIPCILERSESDLARCFNPPFFLPVSSKNISWENDSALFGSRVLIALGNEQ